MGLQLPVYMDAHATTPCDPAVIDAMLPTLGRMFGNAASSHHAFGWEAEALVEQARELLAGLIGATPSEIIFTSGATESDNLAIKGVAHAYRRKGRHLITSQIEHHAVLHSFQALEREGFEVTYLPVDRSGRVDPEDLRRAIRNETILVSVMAANNEIGVIQPLAEIGAICAENGIFFHTDAVQALAHVKIDVNTSAVDLLSVSAHKMYGPKGVGALYIRRRNPRVRLEPLLSGGGHERGLRPGTLNVTGIVGLGKAAELVVAARDEESRRIARLRDRLQQRLLDQLDGVRVNGGEDHRLPNNLHVTFQGVKAEWMLKAMRNVAVSSGAACASASNEPSHVLRALGATPEDAESSLRFGLHRFTTEQEVDFAADLTVKTVQWLRQNTPDANLEYCK